jgi:hypothetical protein
MYYKNLFKFVGFIVLFSFYFNFSISETLTKSYYFNGKNLNVSVDEENKERLISIYGLDENLSKYGTIKENNIDNICKKYFSILKFWESIMKI